jgi:hypothetical protein
MPKHFDRMYKALERNKQKNKEAKAARLARRLEKYRKQIQTERDIANYYILKSKETRA